MRLHLAFAILALLTVASAPAAAQTHSSAIGFNAGPVLYSSFNSGATEVAQDLKPDLGFVGSVQYDWYVARGVLGFRLGGHYQRLELDWTNGTREIYAYAGDFDLLLRPVRPKETTRVIPYLSLGVGLTQYRLGSGLPTSYEAGAALYDGDESPEFSVLGGIGFDIVTGWGWDEGAFLIRLEAQDNYVTASPFVPTTGGGDFNGVHNIRITLGLHNSMGVLR